MHRKHSIFKISFISLLGLFLLAGCQQNIPELTQSNYSVIFDYENEETLPESRLCIFMESASDVRRYNHIQISAEEEGLVWNLDEISRVSSNGIEWAGNTNLVVPQPKTIPQGMYEIIYFNADEKKDSVKMNISYDSSLYSLTCNEVAEYMKGKAATSEIVIYDADGHILYYGNKTSDFSNVRGIWNTYSNAESYQDIWSLPGRFTMCILPVKKVELEKIKSE
ncbi:MAG: hypothetical protein K6C97_11010 [Treponema sp.]|nr:hypothetical protein [Treponema sp.]